jgi:hypothetical protein
MTRGLIALIHKVGDREYLSNWRPITLLNSSYKIFAKALQIRLQVLLPDIIHADQSAFLPLRFILDNVLVQHETIAWAEESNQDLILLKLDFTKAYDVVSWRFLFRTMATMGLPSPFIDMIRLLFRDARAAVSLNGEPTESFEICRRVRQGCPLAPYLFLLVGETLHAATRAAVAASTLSGIMLPDGVTQQTLLQYADDTTFTLAGEEHNLLAISSLLQDFGYATGLVYNPQKSVLYWFSQDAPPGWLQTFGCQIARTRDLSKPLGTPFGLSLKTDDVDSFLQDKITKKLSYWNSQFLSLAARRVIVNSILLSTLWFFIHIWAGSDSIIQKIRASLRDYLWSGTEGHAIARVGWDDCCAVKEVGGLNLIDPEEALVALSSKWVLRVLEPGTSALHTLLRYRLGKLRPSRSGTWPPSLQWALTFKFTAPRGTRIWNRLVQSWKRINKFIDAIRPRNSEEVLRVNLWWTT